MKLSVLDQSVIRKGGHARQALQETVQLAQMAEELALSQDMWLLAVENGIDTRIPSVEEAKSMSLTKEVKAKIQENRNRMIVCYS
ncbi:hypothetical protein ACFOU2_22095 [Bacillus songklensis]|uniref:Uncharacterized protein n=1 Tax=Bacillus songklensis TaxID=1069116 RepID=A0ABV8B6Z0_9BACI